MSVWVCPSCKAWNEFLTVQCWRCGRKRRTEEEMAETRPSAIVRTPLDPDVLVKDATTVELLTTCLTRLTHERDGSASKVARELSTAITHIEDAITRTNKGHYRSRDIFAITDAER